MADPLDHLDAPFDMMIHFGPAPSTGSWFSRVLRRVRLRLFAVEPYLRQHGTPSVMEDLERHRLMHWRVNGVPSDAWPLLAGGELAIRPWCRSWNVQLLHAVAAASGGILLGPDDLAVHDPLPEALVPVLGDVVGGEVPVRVLSPAPMNADPNTREMLRSIQGALAALPTT